MASLRRKDGSKYFFACFTLPNGKQTQRSTKQTDRKKAQKIADTFEEATKNKWTESQIRKVMSELFKEVSGHALPSSSLEDYCARFLEQKGKEGTSTATLVRYGQLLKLLREQLGDRSKDDISSVTKADIERFFDSFSGRLSNTTANIALKMIRAFLQEAWRADLVTENVAAKVKTLPTDDAAKRRAFTIPELQRIIEAAGNSEWRGLILFGLYTGARLGDIALCTWNSVHGLESKAPEVRFKTRKTGRQQIIPLAPALVRYLTDEIASSDNPAAPLFPKAYRIITGQDRAGTLSNGFHAVLETAGLAGPRSRKNTGKGRSNRRITSDLSFHSLRHTTTSLLKSAGISASVAMDIVGHDTAAISQNYTHLEDNVKRAALNKLPDLTK